MGSYRISGASRRAGARKTRKGAATVATLLAFALVSSSAASSRAADPTTNDCIAAAEASVKLRAEHQLRTARSQLLVCAAASCPADVQAECIRRVEEVNATIPTIVFLIKDGAGNDVSGARVTMDGQPLVDRLAGTAISLDPGEHHFVFEGSGLPRVEKTFVLHDGEKERRERISLVDDVAGTVPLAPPAAERSSTPGDGANRRIAGLVVGGAGVAGLALGTVFGLLAKSKWSSSEEACSAGSCPDHAQAVDQKDGATGAATVSTVFFLLGGVAVATGAVLYFTAPKGHAAAWRIEPTFAPSLAGVSLRGAL